MKEEDQVYCKKFPKSEIDSTRHGLLEAILRGGPRWTKKNNAQSLDVKGRLKTPKWEVEKRPHVEPGKKNQPWQEGFACLDCFPIVQFSRQAKFVESKSSSLSAKNFLFGDQHTNWMKALCFG